MTIQFKDGEINLETKIKMPLHSIKDVLTPLEIDGLAARLADITACTLIDYQSLKTHTYPHDMEIYINTDENEEV